MSKQVSSFNAKTHLSDLLSQVQEGKEFIITRHKHAIARLIPIADKNEKVSIANIIDKIKLNRKNYTLNLKGGIQKLRAEGRR